MSQMITRTQTILIIQTVINNAHDDDVSANANVSFTRNFPLLPV